MIGLDTNLLLRAVTKDDAIQSPVARHLLQQLTKQTPGYINIIVLSEFAWTLDRRYAYSRAQIGEAIEALLASTSYAIAERDAVNRALTRAEEQALDFSDSLLCEQIIVAGCTTTMTFDKKAARQPGFSHAG